MTALRIASPRYSSLSLFWSELSFTERCVRAVLYNTALPGTKPRIFRNCFRNETIDESPLKILSNNPTLSKIGIYNVIMWKCDNVEGDVKMWKCDNVEMEDRRLCSIRLIIPAFVVLY